MKTTNMLIACTVLGLGSTLAQAQLGGALGGAVGGSLGGGLSAPQTGMLNGATQFDQSFGAQGSLRTPDVDARPAVDRVRQRSAQTVATAADAAAESRSLAVGAAASGKSTAEGTVRQLPAPEASADGNAGARIGADRQTGAHAETHGAAAASAPHASVNGSANGAASAGVSKTEAPAPRE